MSANLVETWDNYPFGAEWQQSGSADPDERRFTGHPKDDETGNLYAGARYYAESGRWLRSDPMPADSNDPQTLNRYSYVLNDPAGYRDPDGRLEFGQTGCLEEWRYDPWKERFVLVWYECVGSRRRNDPTPNERRRLPDDGPMQPIGCGEPLNRQFSIPKIGVPSKTSPGTEFRGEDAFLVLAWIANAMAVMMRPEGGSLWDLVASVDVVHGAGAEGGQFRIWVTLTPEFEGWYNNPTFSIGGQEDTMRISRNPFGYHDEYSRTMIQPGRPSLQISLIPGNFTSAEIDIDFFSKNPFDVHHGFWQHVFNPTNSDARSHLGVYTAEYGPPGFEKCP